MRRLRPVLMTASITAFGLIPLLFASGPGSEIQRPLAIVVIGGLISSTFADVILLPILYRRFGGVAKAVTMTAVPVCLTLVAGREVRQELFDYLGEQTDSCPASPPPRPPARADYTAAQCGRAGQGAR